MKSLCLRAFFGPLTLAASSVGFSCVLGVGAEPSGLKRNSTSKAATDVDLDHTQGLQRSSFLVMTHFLLRAYDILPKKELHSSLGV